MPVSEAPITLRNAEWRTLLEAKTWEYIERLVEDPDPGTLMKLALIDGLLRDGAVDPARVRSDVETLHGPMVDGLYQTAVEVVRQYAQTGGVERVDGSGQRPILVKDGGAAPPGWVSLDAYEAAHAHGSATGLMDARAPVRLDRLDRDTPEDPFLPVLNRLIERTDGNHFVPTHDPRHIPGLDDSDPTRNLSGHKLHVYCDNTDDVREVYRRLAPWAEERGLGMKVATARLFEGADVEPGQRHKGVTIYLPKRERWLTDVVGVMERMRGYGKPMGIESEAHVGQGVSYRNEFREDPGRNVSRGTSAGLYLPAAEAARRARAPDRLVS